MQDKNVDELPVRDDPREYLYYDSENGWMVATSAEFAARQEARR